MKFKDYLNSLVSRRKSNTSSTKSPLQLRSKKTQPESPTSTDCHYDVCGYEDINSIMTDDSHSRTQVLLQRHAKLVNNIVETRSSLENPSLPCSQCRTSYQPSPRIPTLPPPLPPKLSLDQQSSYSNRNYSSTLATCSPRRECQQQQQSTYYPSQLTTSQYSTPNPSIISSSSNSLWTTTGSLSKKQRSRIRTNPWIGKTAIYHRPSSIFQHHTSPIPSLAHPEYGIYDPTFNTSPSNLIHSESFPQTSSNGNTHTSNPPPPPPEIAPTSSVILHQSDSGHGFSLASSRVMNSLSTSSPSSSPPSSSLPPSCSSSPDDTSGDGLLSNGKPHYRQKKLKKKTSSTSPSARKKSPKHNIKTEQPFCSNTISSDSGSLTRRKKAQQMSPSVTVQYRYQRPSTTPGKPSNDSIQDKNHSLSSSSHSIDDHFSLKFEEILENERSYKHRKDTTHSSTKLLSPKSISPSKSPFILPLEETNIKLSSPPPPIVFSQTLTKTNSRAILKHIEEIENEIRLIKNLDLANEVGDEDEYVFSPHAYPEEDIDLDDENEVEEVNIKDGRQSIYEQVDQWVEKCLTTTSSTENPANLLHSECDHLSNTIKNYVGCVCDNNDRPIPPASTPQQPANLMTAFYLSSILTRTTKRTASFITEPTKLEESQLVTQPLKPIHECPF